MSSSRIRSNFQPAEIMVGGHFPVSQQGSASLWSSWGNDDYSPAFAVFLQPVVKDSEVLLDIVFHYCPVFLHDLPFTKLLGQPGCCLAGPGKEQNTRNHAVQPVNNAQKYISRFAIFL